MNKEKILLPGFVVASLFALFAFTAPPVHHVKIPDNVWTDFAGKEAAGLNETETATPKSRRLANIQADTTPPIQPRFGDFLNDPSDPSIIDLKDPKVVDKKVEYDPISDRYIITEKIGDDFFRTPTYMTFSEYLEWQAAEQQSNYFDKLFGVASGDRSSTGLTDPLSKLATKKSLVERLFGGTNVDIKPQGNIDLRFGVNHQRIENPTLTERQRRQTNFDFDMNISMNATGKIGEKLNLGFNYNTQATFDFDNTMKINYDPLAGGFGEDEILQGIEAGNVSFPLKSQLIKGATRLFGVRTDLKFGRLKLTTVASQQQSKQQNLTVQGGGQLQEYIIPIDEYDENRHFFLSHYNRSSFENSLKCLPTVQSLFKITKIQVWATNENANSASQLGNQGAVKNPPKEIVCLADLGEPQPFNTDFVGGTQSMDLMGLRLPDNRANTLYNLVRDTSPEFRYKDKVVQKLTQSGLKQVQDFEKLTAKMLEPNSEFTWHEDLGFISINLNVQTDHIVGVAYEYTYNGIRHQVGEFAKEVSNQGGIEDPNDPNKVDSLHQNVTFVKMLKPRTANVKLPIWDLMMKNVYAVGASQVDPTEFRFDIKYDDGKGEKRFLPVEAAFNNPIARKPLLQVFRLDTLNQQRDPGPDGVFDFVPGLTINLRSGRVMFPVLEPFGSWLEAKFDPANNPDADTLAKKYCFFELYDSTTTVAREHLDKNRFYLRGSMKSANSKEISLGSFNIPQGSVRVSGGGIQMVEGRDYEIDYNIGKVRILNDAVLQSGSPVNISFEDNTLFGFNQRTMLGVRADYEFSKNVSLGATWMNLFERPLTQKVNFGDDPINNKMYGVDFNYSKEAPFLTRLVDKIPLINTKAASNITFQAEVAALTPGHSRAINSGLDQGGVVYVDDFEGSSSGFDLRTPYTAWNLASIPQNDWATPNRWPESNLTNDLAINSNRAKMVWYSADPSARITADISNPYTQVIPQEEIFPNKQLTPLDNSFLRTFDLTYYPYERGPYNFELPDGYPGLSKGFDPSQKSRLAAPETRWAGIMRGLTTNDFEQANIEFVEFWMLNPFMNKPDDTLGQVSGDGKLLIQLGTMSEDLIKDGNVFYENGLPSPGNQTAAVATNMGRFPFYQPATLFFDNDETNRIYQDVGLDGLPDSLEAQVFGTWLGNFNPTTNPEIFADPSNDNYQYYRSNKYTATDGLLKRYSLFNNSEGNSPPNQGQQLAEASTNYPDIEDVNRDNTFNETESYYSYELPIQNDNGKLAYETNDLSAYVTDTVNRVDAKTGVVRTWYRIKVPLENNILRKTVGGISDFRSIQFIRILAQGFDERVTFRFATFELGRNQWRRYRQTLAKECTAGNDFTTTIDVNSVNIEENSGKLPFNYILPPGIQRETSVGAFPDALQNEQSLSVNVCGLNPCDAKGIYKLLNLDIRQFERLKMFVHAENVAENATQWEKGNLRVFVRLGSDFTKNYYEYSLPVRPSVPDLVMPSDRKAYAEEVWPTDNVLDFPLSLLTDLKTERNNSPGGGDLSRLFGRTNPDKPLDSVLIVGNPNLGLVKGIMIGIRNDDMTNAHCVELWLNELRLTGIDEHASWAGLARTDIKLADFADVQLSTTYKAIGWGGIEDKVQQRSRDEAIQFDAAASIQLDKFLGEKSGVKLPFYTNYSTNLKNPEYDPYDYDLKLKDKLRNETDPTLRRQIKHDAQDAVIIKGWNLTNVRIDKKSGKKLSMPWDISNFALTYAFNKTEKRNPFVESDQLKQYKGGLDYAWSLGLKPIQPFKKLIKKDKYLKFISDFNFNPLPGSVGFGTTLERIKQATTYRFAGADEEQNTFYNKRFTWDRNYDVNWDLSKALKFSYDATAKSIIDEPNEYDYTQQEIKDSILTNLKNLGRMKNFQQNMTASYALPFKLIPYMDWVSSKASVSAGYGWDAASLKMPTFGNVIQNNQTRQINGDFNFESLYNKSKYLSKINKPSAPAKGGGGKKGGSGRGGDDEGGGPGGRDEGGGPGGIPGGKGSKRELAGAAEGGGTLGGAPSRTPPADPRSTPPPDPSAPGLDPSGAGGGKLPGGKPVVPGGKLGSLGGDPGGGEVDMDGDGKPDKPAGKSGKSGSSKDKKKKERQPSILERVVIRPMMTVRKARFNYTETRGTVLPGFMPNAKLLGQDEGFQAPGWNFIAGQQPSDNWLNSAAAKGWMSREILLSQQVNRNFEQKFDATVTLEPFTDFRVELTALKQFSKNNTELFKIPDQTSVGYEHRAQRDMGSFTVSYYNMQTLWNNDIGAIFKNFENSRTVISTRLGIQNQMTTPHLLDKGYVGGYGKIQQDVLVPAFIAAYTKADPQTVGLDIFKTTPKVNWKLTYNGLSKLKPLKKMFAQFNISHGYKSTMTINSYNTDLQFEANNPFALNELNGSYFTRYEIPQLVISEQLQPLIGLDVRFKNDMNFKVDMKKTRQLGMSFINYQLAEQRTTDYTIVWGYKMKNVIIPFLQTKAAKSKAKKEKLAAKKKKKAGEDAPPEEKGGKPSSGPKGNDLKFDFNFSYRDDITTNHQLDKKQEPEATRGSTTIRISPTVDYSLNKQLSLGLFCDYNRTIPKTSASFPITNLQTGLRVRFQLQ